jgi:hypothetical protein
VNEGLCIFAASLAGFNQPQVKVRCRLVKTLLVVADADR